MRLELRTEMQNENENESNSSVDIKEETGNNGKNQELVKQSKNPFEFVCDECDYVYDRRDNFRKHLAQHVAARHKRLEMSVVVNHKASTGTVDDQNSISYHTSRRTTTKQVKYPCDHCGVKFRSHNRLKRHLRSMVSYKCFRCNETFANSKARWNHMVKMHLDISCNECDKNFYSNERYEKHLQAEHADVKQLKRHDFRTDQVRNLFLIFHVAFLFGFSD